MPTGEGERAVLSKGDEVSRRLLRLAETTKEDVSSSLVQSRAVLVLIVRPDRVVAAGDEAHQARGDDVLVKGGVGG